MFTVDFLGAEIENLNGSTESPGSTSSSGSTTEDTETIQALSGPLNILLKNGDAAIYVNNMPFFPPANNNLKQ